ncbi:AAA family ATPase [Kocuria sp.]|uniref:AAA family ATPase n=1 Tax=Kocuria sp. TaxID=1871328 RepID=UPI0026E0DD23|nr:AAA family ATPase [Kocuria sp.]MDO5618766.1 AAA family ATPase [Kocuria sp.]
MNRPETEPWSETNLKLTRASDVRTRRQRWLWDGIIPLGVLTCFAGNGGEGKTTFALDVAARVTHGTLDGDLHGTPRDVILIGAEDDPASTAVPRLKAAGADLERVHFAQVETVTDFHTGQRELKFPMDTSMLRQAVEATNATLIIIDPISSAMSNGDLNKVQDVRAAVEPIAALAASQCLSVILVNHFNKGSGSVRNKVSGSHGFRDVLRSLLVFAKDEETGERILTQDKNNYGTGLNSYKFTIESVEVSTDDGETAEVGRARFLGASDISVGDIINREPGGADDAEDRNAAQEFLLDYLRDQDRHEAVAGDVIKAGAAAGFSRDEMKKARARCQSPRVVSTKSGFGSKGGWVWMIEESPHEGNAPSNGGTFGTLTAETCVPPSQTKGATSPVDDTSGKSPSDKTPSQTKGAKGATLQEGDTFVTTPAEDGGFCQRVGCAGRAINGGKFCRHHDGLTDRLEADRRTHLTVVEP